ncbi:protein FAM98B-like [Salarias fasciatus]|uniref:Protein FAM98B-like n=1 Tax=Salarias fasciatus TaxID=181472 RepID=A0A672GRY6_SALFA|nr:protein FAM98B-like [Salarias fasciatus]
MERSAGTILALKSLGYRGSCLSRCRCDELPCPLLSWLRAELRSACPEIGASTSTGDVLLVGELRNLLSSLSSPLAALTSDVLGPSALSKVTDFLVSELQAARILRHKELNPEESQPAEQCEREQRVKDLSHEDGEFEDDDGSDKRKAEMQAEWVLLLHALDMDTSSPFEDVLSEVEARLSKLSGAMTEPLLKSTLSAEQWEQVKKMNEMLSEDYRCRRQMMIKRFQVTLESFAWGEKQTERRAALDSVPPLASLAGSSQVSLSHLLAARKDQSFIDPVKAGTSTPVYKMLMGSVPDRGGRPGEIEPPMPRWEERKAKGNKWGGGGGHRHKFTKKKKGKRD